MTNQREPDQKEGLEISQSKLSACSTEMEVYRFTASSHTSKNVIEGIPKPFRYNEEKCQNFENIIEKDSCMVGENPFGIPNDIMRDSLEHIWQKLKEMEKSNETRLNKLEEKYRNNEEQC